jgi:hypothetical protein
MEDTVDVLILTEFGHEQITVYWTRVLTFGAVERKRPAATTIDTEGDPKVSIPVNVEDGFSVILLKNTFLE